MWPFLMKEKLLSFLCCLLILFTVTPAHANPDKVLPGASDISFSGRPAQPYENINNYNPSLTESGMGPQYTVPVSRHHIIPLRVIREFYNNVIQNSAHMLRIRSFFLSLSQNLPYFSPGGTYCVVHRSDLENVMTLCDSIGYQLVHHGTGRHVAGIDTLQQFIAWLPGNLFVGPTRRSDDPGDSFESNVEQVVGTDRYHNLLELYRLMTSYNQNIAQGHPDYNDDGIIGAIANYLNRVTRVRRITPLNADNWEKGSDNRYRLRKSFRQKNYTARDEEIAPECKSLKSKYEELKALKNTILHDET